MPLLDVTTTALGAADQVVVGQSAPVGVELPAVLEGDGVHLPAGIGELDEVAGDEGATTAAVGDPVRLRGLGHVGNATVAAMAPPFPASLSPSRASDFTTCPLLFRFRSIDRLPEEPSAAAVRGTLVHRALETLFDLPAQ